MFPRSEVVMPLEKLSVDMAAAGKVGVDGAVEGTWGKCEVPRGVVDLSGGRRGWGTARGVSQRRIDEVKRVKVNECSCKEWVELVHSECATRQGEERRGEARLGSMRVGWHPCCFGG